MSGGFPLRGSLANPQSASAAVIGLALPAANNTKGAYTTLIASTTTDAAFAYIAVDGLYNSQYQGSIDFAFGAAGSEQIFLADLIVWSYWIAYTTKARGIVIPVCIPKGSRVAARAQQTDISAACPPQVFITLFDGDFSAGNGSVIDTLGFNAATTRGTSVTPGSGSKGSYSQISASSPYDYDGFFLAVDPLGGVTQANTYEAIDISIGSAGSEVVFLPNWIGMNYNNEQIGDLFSPFFHTPIKAGSRIAARIQSGATGAIGLTFYGVRK